MYITAPLIHNGHHFLPEGSTLLINDGIVEAIEAVAPAGTIRYDGVLVPGFVNTHCHLELSHMKGVIPRDTGLIAFLQNVTHHRNDFTEEDKKKARHHGLDELSGNGVVAVGDIANSTDTLDLRLLGKMHFHTFIEALGFTAANAERSFGYAESTYMAFAAQHSHSKILHQSITPHAPYSVSAPLFQAIDQHIAGSIFSIHNQESLAEHDFYTSKEGGVRDLLKALGIDDSLFSPTGKSSLQSYLEWVTYERPFLFVHNTYSKQDDVQFVKSNIKNASWCLCPNANLYIENKLPDIQMLLNEGVMMCIGTDSLASNGQLSILAELTSIKQYYPGISWETLIKWATHNGAAALQMEDRLGTIMPGRKPGIIQISDLESNTPSVTAVLY